MILSNLRPVKGRTLPQYYDDVTDMLAVELPSLAAVQRHRIIRIIVDYFTDGREVGDCVARVHEWLGVNAA